VTPEKEAPNPDGDYGCDGCENERAVFVGIRLDMHGFVIMISFVCFIGVWWRFFCFVLLFGMRSRDLSTWIGKGLRLGIKLG
jgi:hypothetical protein